MNPDNPEKCGELYKGKYCMMKTFESDFNLNPENKYIEWVICPFIKEEIKELRTRRK
jgi:hypothetical protein